MKNISIKEVAKLAGVSPTTVSRVINNSEHPVSAETRKRVEEVIKELDFAPNRMAQGLLSNRSNIIGVIVHDISDDYFSEMLKGIEDVVYKKDYIINIYNTYRDLDREIRAVNMLRANRADAVIFTGSPVLKKEHNSRIRKITKHMKNDGSIIVGVTAHPYTDKNFAIGNLEAAREISNYLFDKGHSKIAYINGPELLTTCYQRYRGFLQAFKEHKVKFDQDLVFSADFSFAGGRKVAVEIIEKINEITAVVAANDETALGLIWELKNKGFSIPENLSVVGIGGIPSARFSYPPLTTLSLPIYQTGLAVGRYILKKLKEDDNIINFDNGRELVERKSVLDLNE